MTLRERRERAQLRVEALRLELEAEELRGRVAAARADRRRAELELVKAGLRVECDQGCGRPVPRDPRASPTCHACRNKEWMRRARAEGAIPIRGAR